jgi:hypothetical protein
MLSGKERFFSFRKSYETFAQNVGKTRDILTLEEEVHMIITDL